MGGNEINVAIGVGVRRRRTACGRECVKMKSMSLLLLNSGHNARSASEGGQI